ncbi:MAG: LuxR C-terminal-related transcriptional regulator [Verrucomicrobiota bacterium]
MAAELSLSFKTVSTYRTRLLQKLALRTNAELVKYALREGLIKGSDS